MQAQLTSIHRHTGALLAVDVGALAVDDLGALVLSVQAELDRLRTVQSRLLLAADRSGVWKRSGHRSVEDWLAATGKTTRAAAGRAKKLGESMEQSPELADAVVSGEISPDTAAELAPVLASEHSGDVTELVDACKGATPAQAREAGTLFQAMHPADGDSDREREHRLRQRRGLRFTDQGDGLTRIDGQITTADAAVVKASLSATAGRPTPGDDRTHEQRTADALVQLCTAYAQGEVHGGRQRPTVVVVIDVDVLEGRAPGAGRTNTGELIPAEIVRRMCTNANLVRLLTSGSVPLDLGRSQRLASDAQYLALAARDGGCRMESCTIPPEWCQIDHILEWDADHGPTDIDWLVLWCPFHHHVRHAPGVTLHGDANNLSITLPDGRTIPLPARGARRRRGPDTGRAA